MGRTWALLQLSSAGMVGGIKSKKNRLDERTLNYRAEGEGAHVLVPSLVSEDHGLGVVCCAAVREEK